MVFFSGCFVASGLPRGLPRDGKVSDRPPRQTLPRPEGPQGTEGEGRPDSGLQVRAVLQPHLPHLAAAGQHELQSGRVKARSLRFTDRTDKLQLDRSGPRPLPGNRLQSKQKSSKTRIRFLLV